MTEVWSLVKSTYRSFNGTGMYITLFYVAILYISLKKEEKQARYYFVYPSLFLLFIIFNPFTAELIGGHLAGWDVYWRIFWTLPLIGAIAYCASRVVKQQEGKFKKIFVQIAIVLIIMLSGKFMLNTELFSHPENLYKIPQEVVEVADMVLEDSQKPKIAAPLAVSCYIRQYSGEIEQVYGRNVARGDSYRGGITIYEQLSSDAPNLKVLIRKVRAAKCNYLVVPISWNYEVEFAEYKYEELGCTNSYVVYKDTTL